VRVGVISKGSPDYLIDVVTDGLIRLLGRHNVSLDYNVRMGWGPYIHLMSGFEGPEPFDIREADALIASNRSMTAMREWRKSTAFRKPVAFIDGEDGDLIHGDVLGETKVYFKREYMKGRAYPKTVRPLPFAAIPEARPGEIHAKNPVFFMAGETHPFRAIVAGKLREMGHSSEPHHLAKSDYNKRLTQSMIGVSVRGNGWDTYRYWEIPYFGALLFSQRLGIVIPNDFRENEEALFFDDMPSLQGSIQGLLADPSRLKAVAHAGRAACMNRHLSVHRARTVLEAIV